MCRQLAVIPRLTLPEAMRRASTTVEKFGRLLKALAERVVWLPDSEVLPNTVHAIYRSKEHYRQYLECLSAHYTITRSLF